MANTLASYNPTFYAQEALIQLEESLGMATRVYRGYEQERNAFNRGDTINVKKPATFTAENAPDDGGQDLYSETVAITLDQWKEVKFVLTDQELSQTSERIIQDHIRPAMVALADNIDTALAALYKDVPWQADCAGGSAAAADILTMRKGMFDNKVPLKDANNMFAMVNGQTEADLLALTIFGGADVAGGAGEVAQRTGDLGRKFGFNFFANQNAPTHTGGGAADLVGAVDGAGTKGDTTLGVDALSASATIKAGATITLTGYTQRYALTADLVTDTAGAGTAAITPPLAEAIADDTEATFVDDTEDVDILGFHRNAFALVIAPLSDMANNLGAKVVTVTDPITGLSLRHRIYYVGNDSAVHVAFDVLYGVKTLDGNLAYRMADAT